ncbi:MAG: ABC transporter ATP-binding protein, partial [Roseiflexaceae bacterium]|nr:ABC transporter ATP-binding protein [Roseiflexaceae bacterium]
LICNMSVSNNAIELRSVSKWFQRDTPAVDQVSLQAPRGALIALLGPSGCGKTTTLRLIAGLETPDTGEIFLAGERVAGGGAWVPPERRRVGMVFQDYALFPHLTVRENVAFGLNGRSLRERAARVDELLTLTGLADLADRYPHQLSGGQQQRVALARALAPDPQVILLDEPFSNLDAVLRKATREEVRRILRQSGATAVFVTHDQEEAFSIADLVAVMRNGAIEQIGAPHEIYLRPATRTVATFVGEANFVPAHASGRCAECVLGKVLLATPRNGPVEVMVRPEALDLCPDAAGCGLIEEIVFFGHDQLIGIRMCDGTLIQARTGPRIDIVPGARVAVRVQGEAVAFPCAENRELRTEN